MSIKIPSQSEIVRLLGILLYNPNNHNFDSILRDGFVRTFDALTKAGKEIYIILDTPRYANAEAESCIASVVRRPVVVPNFLGSITFSV